MSRFNQRSGSILGRLSGFAPIFNVTDEQRRRAVKARGFSILPGDRVVTSTKTGAGGRAIPVTGPLSDFGPRQPSNIDFLTGALGKDINFLQENVVNPTLEQQGKFGAQVEAIEPRILGAAGEARDVLERRDEELAALQSGAAASVRETTARADEVADLAGTRAEAIIGGAEETFAGTEQRLDEIAGNIDQFTGERAGAAISAALSAIGTARSAITGFNSETNATIRAITNGLDQRVENQARLIEAGIHPDGTAMSPGEQQAARRQLQFDTNLAVGQTTAQLKDASSRFIAGLKQNLVQTEQVLAQVELAVGQLQLAGAAEKLKGVQVREGAAERRDRTTLGAAQFDAQVGLAAADFAARNEVEAAKIEATFADMRNGVASSIANLIQTSELQAIQLGLQGRESFVNMLKTSPFISMFEGLAALMAISTAGGGGGGGRAVGGGEGQRVGDQFGFGSFGFGPPPFGQGGQGSSAGGFDERGRATSDVFNPQGNLPRGFRQQSTTFA